MRDNSVKPLAFSAALVAVYSVLFVAYMGRGYPVIGHDFSFFMPRLVDTYLHYAINGLTIQWYTPSFGGGVPAYANPQSLQFSLLQLLTSFTNPWKATEIAISIYIAVGFGAAYFFLKDLAKLDWTASILGALLFVVNGFYIQHMSVGHLSFMGFTLLPAILYFLFRESESIVFEGLMLSAIVAIIFYGAGIYILVIFVFSLLLILPTLYVFRSQLFKWKLLGLRGLVGISWAIGLILSKFWAVIAFIRLFPREISYNLHSSWLDGLSSIAGQLFGTMTMAPLYWLTERNLVPFSKYFSIWIGPNHNLWEYDSSLSPVLWFLLGLGIFWVIKDIKKPVKLTTEQHLAVFVLAIMLTLTVGFILAKGPANDFLKRLPVIKSLNVSLRFTAALIYPLSIIGAISYNRLIEKNTSFTREVLLFLFSLITFVFLLPYFRVPEKYSGQWFNTLTLIDTYYSIKNGEYPLVKRILDVRDAETIPDEASNLYPHDPMFGYGAEAYQPEISVGPVSLVEDGYFNINNASSLLYPAINNTRPFERIKVDEKEHFYNFINRHQPAWKRPTSQYVADGLSFICLIATIVFLIGRVMKVHLPNRLI